MSHAVTIEFTDRVRADVGKVMVVAPEVLDPVLAALVSRGHVLIEGIPGTGKTLLARTLAKIIGLEFKRIQFTNDLMPADIVGSSVWRRGKETFEFIQGPLFANLVLADEINRTSPRTLSCLLEAMENGTVSIDGDPVALPAPFFVLATRNPIEFHGTYPIPEAALDRFLVRVTIEYPAPELEIGLYLGEDPERVLATLDPVIQSGGLRHLMDQVDTVQVQKPMAEYAYEVAAASRAHEAVALGVSPRAAMSWIRVARARALLDLRDYVLPDDLKALARPVLAHRIFLKGGGDAAPLLDEILGSVAVKL